MTKSISAQELHDQLTDGGEIALLDVREEGVFAKRHILRACPMALSRLEVMVAKLVPRRGCRIVLCDAADGLSERAAERRPRRLSSRDLSTVPTWSSATWPSRAAPLPP